MPEEPSGIQKDAVTHGAPEGPYVHLQDNLRQALEEGREISFDDYGTKKIVSVKVGGLVHRFGRNDEYEWVEVLEDEKGNVLETQDIPGGADTAYLERLFAQDIPNNVRQVLEQNPEVSYEDGGEKRVVTAKLGARSFKFYRDFGREYADWAMDTYDENGTDVTSIGIKEQSDVEYLEKLFDMLASRE